MVVTIYMNLTTYYPSTSPFVQIIYINYFFLAITYLPYLPLTRHELFYGLIYLTRRIHTLIYPMTKFCQVGR